MSISPDISQAATIFSQDSLESKHESTSYTNTTCLFFTTSQASIVQRVELREKSTKMSLIHKIPNQTRTFVAIYSHLEFQLISCCKWIGNVNQDCKQTFNMHETDSYANVGVTNVLFYYTTIKGLRFSHYLKRVRPNGTLRLCSIFFGDFIFVKLIRLNSLE